MRRIPTITKNLLIINALMFLALLVFQMKGINLNDVLGLHFFMASDFHLYQLKQLLVVYHVALVQEYDDVWYAYLS